MDLGTFKFLLKKLNPRIFVDENHRVFTTNKELGSSGIYLRGKKYDHIDSSVLDGDARKSADAYNDSNDIYIGWVTHGIVPEGDIFDENGRIIARGWRTTIKSLCQKGYIDEKKAKKVFSWNPSDYDMMNYEQKLEFERKYGSTITDIGVFT